MRIVIDLQGAQAENRHRGIGRYSLSLTLSIARHKKDHEIYIALNDAFPESIRPIRAAFKGLIPPENVCVWSAPIGSTSVNHQWQREASAIVRDAFLANLRPDVVLVSSIFEGFESDAITDIAGISDSCLKAVILYDLIPLLHPDIYLKNPDFDAWYRAKIDDLKRADCWFAISESSKREGIENLELPEDRVLSISADAHERFKINQVAPEDDLLIKNRFGLHNEFVMYTGGIDHRKNIPALIRAYAALPSETRALHQLAIVCAISDVDRQELTRLATDSGLDSDDVVFTGFVSEEVLIALYNLCKLFVFPSWHEGFGLPALEAMRCGAPVIAGNLSSLPEVIGWDEALFDPHSEASITAAILRGLEDTPFRQALINHGKQQALLFSWDLSAKKFISFVEKLCADKLAESVQHQRAPYRPKLAYLSPLPPERSGISDYSAVLLPALANFYEIDVIVTQEAVSDCWIMEHCAVRHVDWFVANAGDYARVLYHFGNSSYHQHMLDLIEQVPGVIVLHDFFLSGLVSWVDGSGLQPGLLDIELYRSHGYRALKGRAGSQNPSSAIWEYPCNLSVIDNSLGVIVHSKNALRLCHQWYKIWPKNWAVIPLLRAPSETVANKVLIRESLGLKKEDFVVCAFGLLGPTKLNDRLVNAWLDSALSKSASCHLIFVGENDKSPYGQRLNQIVNDQAGNTNIRITGWVDADLFRDYLAIADVGVQLRTLSRGETSAAVLDCMNYGIATIINSNGNLIDISEDVVLKLPDDFTNVQLVEALELLWRNDALRHEIGKSAKETILKQHAPEECAGRYYSAIERFYGRARLEAPGIPDRIAHIKQPPSDSGLMDLAKRMSTSFAPEIRQSQLLVDVSELVQRDAQSGIQRVVKHILGEWLNKPPAGYRVEPVYVSSSEGLYRYARQFTLGFVGCTDNKILADDPIDCSPGDIFFILDLQPELQTAMADYYQRLRDRGITVKFMVYDLLCVTMPQYFFDGADTSFGKWLGVVAKSDGAVCISKTVSTELQKWMEANAPECLSHFDNRWFHLGADFDRSISSAGFPSKSMTILKNLHAKTSFLLVGTIEPRKGHEQTLDAFELLWSLGVDINLTIVGKPGWLVDHFVNRLKAHKELNNHLIWLNGISDEYLEAVYEASDCLIAASYGEGFGLPLIEAAHHGLPILARDIPVFREVAGNSAFYFKAETPEAMVEAIQHWLTLYSNKAHPISNGLTSKRWHESAAWLAHELVGVSLSEQNISLK